MGSSRYGATGAPDRALGAVAGPRSAEDRQRTGPRIKRTAEGGPRAVVWASVGIYAAALGVLYLLPSTLKRELSFTIGNTRVVWVEAGLLALLLLHRRVANRLLFWWGLASLAYGILNGIGLARNVEVSSSAALQAHAPLILLALFPFSERYRTPLKLAVTGLLVAITAEVILFSAGVLSYPSVSGLQYGSLTRISTTVGSSTGTAAVLFMLGAWALDLWGLNWKGVLLAWVSALGIASTFSRGPMVMMGVSALAASAAWIFTGKRPKGRFVRLLAASSAVAILVGAASWAGELIGLNDALEVRLDEGVADAGRVERYTEAWNTFSDHAAFGVGTGEYYARERTAETGFSPVARTSPHNVFLLVLAENGVIGGAILAGGLGWLLVRVARRWRERPLSWCVIAIAVIGFNTEVLYVESQFALLLAGLFAWFDRASQAQQSRT